MCAVELEVVVELALLTALGAGAVALLVTLSVHFLRGLRRGNGFEGCRSIRSSQCKAWKTALAASEADVVGVVDTCLVVSAVVLVGVGGTAVGVVSAVAGGGCGG